MWQPRNEAEADAAERAVGFVRNLTHTKGKWAGTKFDLLPWQENGVIRPIFGALRPDGNRQVRTAYVEVPRKNGKSELAAAIALKLLFADDEAGGEVYGAAADRDQASIVFNVAAQMVRNSPALSKRARIIDSSKRIIVTKGVSAGSVYRAIPADAAGSHGFNASAVIVDEVHVQPSRELWDVLSTSTGARTQPLMLGITTAGYDRNSLCWELHEYAQRVVDGIVEDPSFWAVLYSADTEDDWTSPETWRKANPSYGVTIPSEYFEQECKRALQVPAYQNTFRRLHLNQWVSQESRWIDMQTWDASGGIVAPKALEGRPCYGGLDLASTTDLAAFVLIFPPDERDGDYYVLSWFWVPEENMVERSRRDRVPYDVWVREGHVAATPGNQIDFATIRRTIEALHLRFDIREVAFDQWGAIQMTQELEAAGMKLFPMRQGFASFAAPTRELLRLAMIGHLRHGGQPVLRWMADSVTMEQDAAGNLKPSKRKSTQRIDGIVALTMALDRAMRHFEAREPGFLGYLRERRAEMEASHGT